MVTASFSVEQLRNWPSLGYSTKAFEQGFNLQLFQVCFRGYAEFVRPLPTNCVLCSSRSFHYKHFILSAFIMYDKITSSKNIYSKHITPSYIHAFLLLLEFRFITEIWFYSCRASHQSLPKESLFTIWFCYTY